MPQPTSTIVVSRDGRQHGVDQRRQNLPPRDKPPVALFDLGVKLELFGLHGDDASRAAGGMRAKNQSEQG